MATRADTRNLEEQEKSTLDVIGTGAAWNRTAAFWAGRVGDTLCKLCGENEDSPDHLWTCKALDKEREEADGELAAINPETLPMAIKCGIAPAMKASTKRNYWGKKGHDRMTENQRRICGCRVNRKVHIKFADTIKQIDE